MSERSVTPTEPPLWSQTIKASFLGVLVMTLVAEVVLFIFLSIFVSPALWVATVLVTALLVVLVLSFATVSLSFDREGIHVRYGTFGWPHIDVPFEDVVSANVIDIRPMRWGGWGYRGSLKAFGKAAVIMRAGPGVQVHLTRDRLLVMTVDDPEQAVAAIMQSKTG